MKKPNFSLPLTLCAAMLGLAGAANAQESVPYDYAISDGTAEPLVVTGTGEVSVSATFLSESADDNDELFLAGVVGGTETGGNPLPTTVLFDNQDTSEIGTSISLGTFTPGTELIFELDNTTAKDIWYSGSDSSLNSDSDDHFDVFSQTTTDGVPTTSVGVEDLPENGTQGPDGSIDFNDLEFSFSGISAETVPDMPGTLTLLGLGLTGLTAFGRRFRK